MAKGSKKPNRIGRAPRETPNGSNFVNCPMSAAQFFKRGKMHLPDLSRYLDELSVGLTLCSKTLERFLETDEQRYETLVSRVAMARTLKAALHEASRYGKLRLDIDEDDEDEFFVSEGNFSGSYTELSYALLNMRLQIIISYLVDASRIIKKLAIAIDNQEGDGWALKPAKKSKKTGSPLDPDKPTNEKEVVQKYYELLGQGMPKQRIFQNIAKEFDCSDRTIYRYLANNRRGS